MNRILRDLGTQPSDFGPGMVVEVFVLIVVFVLIIVGFGSVR